MISCDICGKEFKNTQGLRGHKTFVHQVTSSSSKLAAPPATEQQLSILKNRLDKLENIIGIREPSKIKQLLGITDEPITVQLDRHNNRLFELSEQLTNISQQVKQGASNNTEVRNLSKQVSQLTELVDRRGR